MAWTMASALSSGKKGVKRPKLTDFVLRFARRRQSQADMLEVFRALAEQQEGPPRVDNR